MESKLVKKEPLGNGFFINVSKHHTFGTDAVVLSDFANARKSDSLVDLGTGCGIIPFIMLRNKKLKSAIGVDISSEAIELAKRTSSELNISNIQFIEGNFTELSGKIEFGSHTLVTCNPPYKSPKGGIKSKDTVEAVARHEIACTLEDIIKVSSKLLQTGGRLCMCHRPERLSELMHLMTQYGMEPKRIKLVCQRIGEEPWLVLVEAKKSAHVGLRISPTLYVEEKGNYSKEMLRIYGSYKEAYLH